MAGLVRKTIARTCVLCHHGACARETLSTTSLHLAASLSAFVFMFNCFKTLMHLHISCWFHCVTLCKHATRFCSSKFLTFFTKWRNGQRSYGQVTDVLCMAEFAMLPWARPRDVLQYISTKKQVDSFKLTIRSITSAKLFHAFLICEILFHFTSQFNHVSTSSPAYWRTYCPLCSEIGRENVSVSVLLTSPVGKYRGSANLSPFFSAPFWNKSRGWVS